ncbi:MAG: hypothetical protein PHR16_01715 [Methylovulum sp.]|nr:hypothetical protein [Methylovulum sp.]
MKNNNLFLAVGFFVGTAMALFSAASFAADTTTFGGAICRVYDPSKAGQLFAHHSGAINNSSTSSVVVTCPLSRDFNTDINGASVWVKGSRSASATVPFSCTLVSRDFNGNTLASNTNQSVGIGGLSLSLNVAASGINGNYVVACTLPQNSTLMSIVLNE